MKSEPGKPRPGPRQAGRPSAPPPRRAPRSAGSMMRARLNHHRSMAIDSLARLWRAPLASLMTLIVLAIALLLPAILAIILKQAGNLGSTVEHVNQITLYLRDELTPARQEEIRALLPATRVRAIDYISPAQGLEEFREISGFGHVIDAIDSNPLPAVLVVYPASTDSVLASDLLAQLQALPEVEAAELDLLWLQRLQALMGVVQRGVYALAGILAIAVVLVIGNTIRMAIEARRAEILVVKLVGGSNAFVARPFLYTGFWYGLLAGLLAWLALVLLLRGFEQPLASLLALYSVDIQLLAPDWTLGLLLAGGGALLGWTGALLSVMQHLRSVEPH